MIRRLLAAAILLASAVFSTAGAQSLYSLRGYGEDTGAQNSHSRALGSTGAALASPGIFANPALLLFAQRTTFSGTLALDWTKTEESSSDKSRQEYGFTVSNLSLLFPFTPDIVLGLGLLYDRRIDGTIEGEASIESETYTQVFNQEGNMLRFPALLGWRVGGMEIGGGADVLLFTSKRSWQNRFPLGSSFNSSADIDRETLWSIAAKLGARRAFGQRFALGAWGSLPREFRGNRFLESDDAQDDPDDVKIHVEEDLAPSATLGVEAFVFPRLRVVADWTYEMWEEQTPRNPIDEYQDVHRIGVGVEYLSPGRGSFWQSMPIRGGFRFQPLHVLDGNGDQVLEMVASAGSGFGFADGGGQFDWVIEYGRRGDNDNEFQEQFVRFAATLTGFERWTRRRPPEED
jgi:hypothetical protein